MAKYTKMAEGVLKDVGGLENIRFVEHCATRLRIHYYSKNKVDVEAVKKEDKVVGVVEKSGQIQIIIGPEVNDAYNDFLDVSGFNPNQTENVTSEVEDEPEEKNFMYYLNLFGNKCAAIFMPIIPAMITGGLILAIKNLLVNYFGFTDDSGTAQLLLNIFTAGFSFFPVWIGYSFAKSLRMEPIMGGFLGAVLYVCSDAEGLDFLGITVPTVTYASSVLPVILGVGVMYFVDKGLKKIIPEMFIYFLKPILTMVIVTPITLIILGPIGTELSNAVGYGIQSVMSVAGWIAMPILSALYPYMVMLGLDKAFTPIMAQSIAEIGYDPFNMVMGLVSNLCIGGSALAVAFHLKDKGQKGMISSFGVTALCGVTEPAFYGSLIMRPKCLIGTAIGAITAGLIAGVFGLKNYVVGGCPGLLSFFYFLSPDGSTGNIILYLVVSAVAIIVSFVATTVILKKTDSSGK
ncbi:PTS transporter subunit EIIC [Faecalitalea cylindroides]|uniref:PTS transporter subunit EIIC n=1 Tax=Faecalitalea cylindroides TaxID=39483 RepID=UPI00232D4AA2|nr:PTS transporter subunit EIIC [Faecalitalea cylindroides]MDB7951568.1 PTS transporter subunit EIIC [Faecalitalea cylindroides]MDB7958413.1 PTS transporter subunit EIIC [Faecalitalea cylindroides]MDB7960407.1 PTS transporter subunit EIIC [Faecalitalea cylindroides]MDB7962277.1 PTS transporter subunit EIIC [Faecalitalea cylindroides]MDB7964148.1 PTS transporter subunit EIIC [Faecalitalea cylindroides]